MTDGRRTFIATHTLPQQFKLLFAHNPGLQPDERLNTVATDNGHNLSLSGHSLLHTSCCDHSWCYTHLVTLCRQPVTFWPQLVTDWPQHATVSWPQSVTAWPQLVTVWPRRVTEWPSLVNWVARTHSWVATTRHRLARTCCWNQVATISRHWMATCWHRFTEWSQLVTECPQLVTECPQFVTECHNVLLSSNNFWFSAHNL